jgi:hypothetical protein
MVNWLYRYVFRGIGILIVIGMITILILAVSSQIRHARTSSTTPSAGIRR